MNCLVFRLFLLFHDLFEEEEKGSQQLSTQKKPVRFLLQPRRNLKKEASNRNIEIGWRSCCFVIESIELTYKISSREFLESINSK